MGAKSAIIVSWSIVLDLLSKSATNFKTIVRKMHLNLFLIRSFVTSFGIFWTNMYQNYELEKDLKTFFVLIKFVV